MKPVIMARQWKKQKVMFTVPDICLTQVGNVIVPLPYPISQTFNKAKKVSKNVKINGHKAFIKTSHTGSVKGDTKGVIKAGIISGTKGKKATPLTHSLNIKVNKQFLLRVGDIMKMNNGNTIGKIQGKEKGSAARITDDGAIDGDTSSPDYQDFIANQPQTGGIDAMLLDKEKQQAPQKNSNKQAKQVWSMVNPNASSKVKQMAFQKAFNQAPFSATLEQLKQQPQLNNAIEASAINVQDNPTSETDLLHPFVAQMAGEPINLIAASVLLGSLGLINSEKGGKK